MAKQDDVQLKRIERQLPVPLPEADLHGRTEELAGLVNEQSVIETDLAAYGADKRKRLRQIRKRTRELARSISDRQELTMVPCEERRYFGQNKLEVRRLDTRAVVEQRALTGEERQLEIDGATGKVVRVAKQAAAPQETQ